MRWRGPPGLLSRESSRLLWGWLVFNGQPEGTDGVKIGKSGEKAKMTLGSAGLAARATS